MASGDRRRNKRLKRKDEQPASRLENLPRELSLDILSRLPFKSLMQFMYASRFCSQLSQDPNLKRDDPLLILSSKSLVTRDLFFAEIIRENTVVLTKIQTPFNQVKFVASCDSMLCLSDNSGMVYIYNPFTKRCQELQKSYRVGSDRDTVLGFGCHPLANEYKVIKKLNLHIKGTYFSVHTLGESGRISIVKAPLFQTEPSRALVNGRLHWFSARGVSSNGVDLTKKIISFDLLDEQFRDITIPVHDMVKEYYFRCHLTVLRGLLSGAFSSRRANTSFEIWAMKEYDVFDSWTRMLHVDVRYLFLGRRFCSQLELDRVICLLKNGKILVLYRGGVLVSHDLNGGEVTELVVEGKPRIFQAFAHTGSLNWFDASVHTRRY